jgi:tetratricopeptide (TPR) repeat protein
MTLSTMWDASTLPPGIEDGARENAEIIAAALREARDTLCDPSRRGDYEREALLGLTRADPADDLAKSGAKTEYEGAKACLAREDLERAERLARRAHRANPSDSQALAILAWIEALKPQNQDEEQTRARILMLDRAILGNATNEEALYWRAQLYKRIDKPEAAMRDLARIVALNPKNMEAERELRIFEMRVRRGSLKMNAVRNSPPGGTKTPSGLFKNLLKKN